IETVDAKKLIRKMAQAAWACADPRIQYDTTINSWHSSPESGRLNATIPCTADNHQDNSSCNHASLNQMKYLRDDDSIHADRFAKVVEHDITAKDISICNAHYPT
ncbi:vitamin B12-dependent ribonucleotide reductase, partial [Streptomyces sp. BE303]|nr:vitamin B12-dependent ribonucleotide reductase [Streptomyces sp. BE303]